MKKSPFSFYRRWLALGILAGSSCLLPCSAAQAAGTSTTAAQAKRTLPYRISITDKLGISVVGEEELTVVSRVDAKGFVNLKFLGEVNVYGLTISEAQKTIENAYREGLYLRAPQVTITIEDYAPRPVTITGEVKSPNRYSMPPEAPFSLVDLVSLAGGLTNSAQGKKVKVTRQYPDGTMKVFERDVESLMRGKDRDKNLAPEDEFLLEPNDIVFVPIRVI